MDEQWIVGADEAGQRLDVFLAAPGRAGSRSRATDAVARGRVFIDGVEAGQGDKARLVRTGEVVRLWIDRPGSAKRAPRPPVRGGLEIVHEDDDLVVVNKPPGLLTVPLDGERQAPSVLAALHERFRSHRTRTPLVVHRIDRDTSGLVVFALHPAARDALIAQFARRTPERVYLALVMGTPEPPSGTWRDRLSWDDEACLQRAARDDDAEAKDAESDYRVVQRLGRASLVEVRLRTGRQGQIRVQAQVRGHALVGDRRYRQRPGEAGRGDVTKSLTLPRQALHAQRLAFDHPADQRRVEFMAPMADDMQRLVERLRRQARQSR